MVSSNKRIFKIEKKQLEKREAHEMNAVHAGLCSPSDLINMTYNQKSFENFIMLPERRDTAATDQDADMNYVKENFKRQKHEACSDIHTSQHVDDSISIPMERTSPQVSEQSQKKALEFSHIGFADDGDNQIQEIDGKVSNSNEFRVQNQNS